MRGVDSFKIEGRMKTALYVATVARTYRKAIDDYKRILPSMSRIWSGIRKKLENVPTESLPQAFILESRGADAQIYDSNTYVKNYTYLGTVEESEGCRFRIEQKNKFSVGETIEIMKPDGRNVQALVKSICDEEGNAQESAPHPKQILWVELDAPADVYDILRKKAEQ